MVVAAEGISMQESNLGDLIEEALRLMQFNQAALLAAEIDNVQVRETWFEHVLDAQEAYQERQHLLEGLPEPADWFVARSSGNHHRLPLPIHYTT